MYTKLPLPQEEGRVRVPANWARSRRRQSREAEYELAYQLEASRARFAVCNGGYGGIMEASACGAKEAVSRRTRCSVPVPRSQVATLKCAPLLARDVRKKVDLKSIQLRLNKRWCSWGRRGRAKGAGLTKNLSRIHREFQAFGRIFPLVFAFMSLFPLLKSLKIGAHHPEAI